MIWDQEAELSKGAPSWSLTGELCLWSDGSPAHIQQGPFHLSGSGWEAEARISRSTRDGSKWLAVKVRLDAEVRAKWDASSTNHRERALAELTNYVRLRDWYSEDLGVLYLS